MKTEMVLRYPVDRLVLAALLAIAFLTISEQPARACACCETYQVVNVAQGDMLNVREGPGAQFSVIGRLRPGEACIIKNGQRSGSWIHVDANDSGHSGWVNERFLAYFHGPGSQQGSSGPARCQELKRLCYTEGSNWGCNELQKSACQQ